MWRAPALRHAKRGSRERASCEPRACGDCGGLWRGSLCVGCARESSAKNHVNKNLRKPRARPESGHKPDTTKARAPTPPALARVTLHHAPTQAPTPLTPLTPTALARVTPRHATAKRANTTPQPNTRNPTPADPNHQNSKRARPQLLAQHTQARELICGQARDPAHRMRRRQNH